MINQILHTSFLDALKDTANIIPFLLLIFYIIEILEHFYSDKVSSKAHWMFFKKQKSAIFPLFGALLASIPQCGLSVIASTLYIKRFITKGTLIAIYLATSDEAIPVLLSYHDGIRVLTPLILIKVAVGFLAGYLIDCFIKPAKMHSMPKMQKEDIVFEKGCHSHSISRKNPVFGLSFNKEVLLHPLVHTLSVSFFIFFVTFIINIFMNQHHILNNLLGFDGLSEIFKMLIEPVILAIFGIIPNCAVSVGITMMYLKGAITFASCVSGLCAGAGLGILVLIKKNDDKKDTLNIILLLLLISIISGYLINIIMKF